jgi:hypothetical protein
MEQSTFHYQRILELPIRIAQEFGQRQVFMTGLIFLAAGLVNVRAAVTNDVVVGVADGTNFTLRVIRLDGAIGSSEWTYTLPIHNLPISARGMNPVDESVYMGLGSYGLKISSGGTALWGPVSFGNIPLARSNFLLIFPQ